MGEVPEMRSRAPHNELWASRAIDDAGVVVQATVHEAGCFGWELLGSGDRRWYSLGEQVR